MEPTVEFSQMLRWESGRLLATGGPNVTTWRHVAVSGEPTDLHDREALFTVVSEAAAVEVDSVAELVGTLLDELKVLVPEEVDDVEAVLPADLKDLWRDPFGVVEEASVTSATPETDGRSGP